MKPVSFYLVTDTHYFNPSLGADGKAYKAHMRGEQYFIRESSSIIRAVFERIANDKETDIVIIPGDLTKNGEKESHKAFLEELKKLKDSGKKIYVITAGHDYNEHSFAFRNDEKIQVDGASFDELYHMYSDYGYSQSLAFHKRTHSYIAEIASGVRMLAINCDSYNNTKGAVDDEMLAWAEENIRKAHEAGCDVFAICHYPIIPSVPVFDLVGDAKIKEWRKVASFLADNGVELIMTGHMHIQSINEFYSAKGNRLIDICTSCLVGSPAKYRKVTVDENSVMTVSSFDTGAFDCLPDGIPAQEYFDNQFSSAILHRIENALSGGKGIVKHLKKVGLRIFRKSTVGTLGRMLFIKTGKTLRKKKLTDFASDVGLSIFKGDMPYVKGTDEYEFVSAVLKRASFIIKKINLKPDENGVKPELTKMILDTIGNNKGFSDAEAKFELK